MKDWGYSIFLGIRNTAVTQWQQIIQTVFAIIGLVVSVAEFIASVFNSTIGFEFIRLHLRFFLILAFIGSFALNWKPLKVECFVGSSDKKITLRVCNIFHEKGALIVPTNTTFDTTMDNEFISIKSVQGQYQERYFKRNLTKLDHELELGVVENKYHILDDRSATKTKRYPIGTISKVSRNLQHDYFLAIANVNQFGRPENVSFENITESLVSLWAGLNKIGHLENVRIPIIGTGRAGLPNVSRDQIIQEIIFTYLVASQEMNISENLIICIHPSDFKNKNLHWDDLCEYLSYSCKYALQNRELSIEDQRAKGNALSH